MLKPIDVQALPDYRLGIRFADGVTGEVDLSRLTGKGVFVLCNGHKAFEDVRIGTHGEIRWNDDVEICSDALYMENTGQKPENIFPNLKAGTRA